MPAMQTQTLMPAQLATMTPADQANYLNRLPPSQRQTVQAGMVAAVQSNNRDFMRRSIQKIAYCPVAGGSGITANYVAGNALVFDLPVIGGGYAVGLLVSYNLTLTSTNNPFPTPAAPFNLFQELDLNYNGAQIRTHPYTIKLLSQARGHLWLPQFGVPPGFNSVPTIQAQLNGTPSGANGATWVGKMYLPFNALAWDSVPGILPVMGVGNKPQLKLFCASSTIGPDPLLNPLAPSVNTSTATFGTTGTVNVDMVYLDGTNLTSPTPLQANITQEPTLQWYWDTPLNPLNANLLQRQHIATLLEHWYVWSVVIDGNQSGTFANPNAPIATGNIVAMDLSPDSVGQINFVKYGLNTNISIMDFYERRRQEKVQDLDYGVIPWIEAPIRSIPDPDNHNGTQALNMRPGGYPATTHAYQVNSVNAAFPGFANFSNITPRVETFLISMNYDGLRIS